MSNITLEQASAIIDASIAKGHELGFRPLTVAVLDSGGHLVALKREDNSSLLRPQVATGKAWGALGMGESTRSMGQRAQGNPTFFGALAALADGQILTSPGGIIVTDQDDNIVGAVGASGDSGDNDEICIIAGIEAVGLTAKI